MIQRRFKIKDGVLFETTEVRIEDRTELFKYNPLVRGQAFLYHTLGHHRR